VCVRACVSSAGGRVRVHVHVRAYVDVGVRSCIPMFVRACAHVHFV